MTDIHIESLSPELLDDFLAFFDERAFSDNADWAGCYCFFPYHDPANGAWSERSAADNRAAMADAISTGTAGGFLAYADGRVVGWCNAAKRAAYPTLAGLPGDSNRIGATPCFIVDPDWRGKGVATALLAAACEGLQGIDKMEAAPDRNAQSPAQNARGPLSMYVASGYRIVREFPDGTVLVERELT